MEIGKCCLTGVILRTESIKPFTGSIVEYFHKMVGNIKVELSTYIELMNDQSQQFPYDMLMGVSRNAYEEKKEPPIFSSSFIRGGYKSLNPPNNFDSKVRHMLKFIHEHGGKENKKFEFNSTIDSPLAYSYPEEFVRIMDFLESNYWVDISTTHKMGSNADMRMYMGVKMTLSGIEEIQKELPKMPMIGLVDQKISTGNPKMDEKINHAKELFFKEFADMNDKRSACETLSFVLEPLREDLKIFLASSDVSDFFMLVNSFDVRHNKDRTIQLVHEEQLEWVFYTLLNTINTYYKLKKKLP